MRREAGATTMTERGGDSDERGAGRPVEDRRARMVWMDRLRAVLTALVIAHHAAIAYGAAGSWFFRTTDAVDPLLTLFAAVNQAFFMGLFFMLSGYLAPDAIARKGRAAFVADRIVRLGGPILAFGFLLGPLTVAAATASPGAILADFAGRLASGRFVLGPMWFPAALLVFSIALALAPCGGRRREDAPSFAFWALLALATGSAALAIRQAAPVGSDFLGFQLGYFASYVALFAVGARLGAARALEAPPPRRIVVPALIVGLAALPMLPLALAATQAPRFETGFSLAAIVYAFWEPLVALGAIAGLLAWSRRRGDRGAAFWRWAGANGYGAFILHPPILVGATRALAETGTPAMVAGPLATIAAIALSFTLSALARRSRILRRMA